MTSYESRKAEIRELNKRVGDEMTDFTTLKHVILAIARGKIDHAEMMLKHFERNGKIPTCEIAEIRDLIKGEKV